MADLSRKRSRDRLAAASRAVLAAARCGRIPGFSAGSGHMARSLPRTREKQQYQPWVKALEFDEAKRRAEEWLSQLAGSPVRTIKRDTVSPRWRRYLTDLRRHDRADAAKKAEGQFKTALGFDRKDKRYKDPLAALQLEEATKDDFLDWRDRLRPGRLPRTVNRFVRAVTAGLNRAHRLGHIGNPAAWRIEALPDDEESETAVFLTPVQRKGLIAAAPPRRGSLPTRP